MILSPTELEQAIDRSHEISEIYTLNYIDSSNPIRHVMTLKDICESSFSKKIFLKEHPQQYGKQPFRGFYLAFNKDGCKHYDIVILGGQNYCWTRLVVCKELFHVLLEDDKNQNKNVRSIIDEANKHKISGSKSQPEKFLQAELIAEIAAMEFLFPYKDRVQRLDHYKSIGSSPDFAKIAQDYKIPNYFVDEYLSQYMMDDLKRISEIKS